MAFPNLSKVADATRQQKQAGIALILSVAVLAGLVYFFPKGKEEPIVEAPPVEVRPDAYANIRLTGKAAVVYDLSTGHALYEKNARTQLPLASLTKLLTAYAAADALMMNAPIVLTPEALSAEGDSGFSIGESFSVADLTKLALVASSNDAAAALALEAGSVRQKDSEALLKSAAAAVGLSQTYALNGTGLDETDSLSGGYGSAYDIALLAGAVAKKMPEVANATTKPSVSVTSHQGVTHSLPNTDTLVDSFPGLLLSKTGYTELAGGNLAIVFDASFGHPVAVVVLGSTRDERFSDVSELVDATIAHFGGVTP
ncbi:MAG: D-alanyl-D-alanine carboxypeptidase [Candidatus Pacebacteria bacterium]|nr:D-alanyl-D-alanine carboxypeptidase [Candidatus Paceibacterota bacterium]MBP9840542.1 D-alanyl-D-alanine carboxypeptidase [Candidatus Paceibacterota bacterium]